MSNRLAKKPCKKQRKKFTDFCFGIQIGQLVVFRKHLLSGLKPNSSKQEMAALYSFGLILTKGNGSISILDQVSGETIFIDYRERRRIKTIERYSTLFEPEVNNEISDGESYNPVEYY